MPPIQPSLRASLLTGASALAVSLSASGTRAQDAGTLKNEPPALTLWAEGALSWTGGGSFNVPVLPGLTAPYYSFNPRSGYEGAVGLDYRWPNQAWHFVFDFRYGQTRSVEKNSSFFNTIGTFFGVPSTSQGTSHASEKEGHLVADFMIGRDIGLGSSPAQLQFGLRVADLWAKAQVQEASRFTTFYSTSAQAASGSLTSSFFGAGPRLALIGAIPIFGFWSFDYSGGIAELFATRKFDGTVTNSGGGPIFNNSLESTALVFNADGWLALSYSFTPNYKVSGGIRGDFYNDALTTYSANTGGLENVDRLYWGPFIRLTGAF